MLELLVLGLTVVGSLWLVARDVSERRAVSGGIWVVVAWAVIYGSRPVTSWVAGDAVAALPESRDEGNLAEALVYSALIVSALVILLRRGIRWPSVISENRWLVLFYVFGFLSILWSEVPMVTVKRCIKDLGSVVMVLVILSERDRLQAVRAVFVRCAYLCIPLSIVLIRFFPTVGRAYHGYGYSERMFVGVAQHKNTLGVLAFVSAFFLLWDLLMLREGRAKQSMRASRLGRIVILAMCWYVLLKVDSVTSLVCAAIGSALAIAFQMGIVRRHLRRLEVYAIATGLGFWIVDSVADVRELLLAGLGRDMTFTTRTDIWPILLGYQDNVLVGAGFNSFWSGRRLLMLGESVGGIIQAHNGYLETYLNGGLVGVALLSLVLFSAYRRIRRSETLATAEGRMRLVVLLMAIVYNCFEASFNKINLLWLATVFAVMHYERREGPAQVTERESGQWSGRRLAFAGVDPGRGRRS